MLCFVNGDKKFSFQVSPFGKGGVRGILLLISYNNLPSPPRLGAEQRVFVKEGEID